MKRRTLRVSQLDRTMPRLCHPILRGMELRAVLAVVKHDCIRSACTGPALRHKSRAGRSVPPIGRRGVTHVGGPARFAASPAQDLMRTGCIGYLPKQRAAANCVAVV